MSKVGSCRCGVGVVGSPVGVRVGWREVEWWVGRWVVSGLMKVTVVDGVVRGCGENWGRGGSESVGVGKFV